MEKTQVLQEQCSLLSHEGWAPRVGPTMGPTLHVRRGSIAPKTCKNHPLKTCMPQTLLNGIPPSRIESFSWTLTTKKSSYCIVFFLALLKTTVIEEPVAALFENAGIGNPITAAHNWCFINCCNRKPIAVVFKNDGIGSSIVAFYNRPYRLGLAMSKLIYLRYQLNKFGLIVLYQLFIFFNNKKNSLHTTHACMLDVTKHDGPLELYSTSIS